MRPSQPSMAQAAMSEMNIGHIKSLLAFSSMFVRHALLTYYAMLIFLTQVSIWTSARRSRVPTILRMLWAKNRIHRNYFGILPCMHTHCPSANLGRSLHGSLYLRHNVCCSIGGCRGKHRGHLQYEVPRVDRLPMGLCNHSRTGSGPNLRFLYIHILWMVRIYPLKNSHQLPLTIHLTGNGSSTALQS